MALVALARLRPLAPLTPLTPPTPLSLQGSNSLADFIVPDDECEPFTLAGGSSAFVRETHAAVRAFEDWMPKTEDELQAKEFMTRLERSAVGVDDEARFARGMAGIRYH